jgi:hypothetical protein
MKSPSHGRGNEQGSEHTPIAARRKIEERFCELPIFKRSRSSALYHYCAALDISALEAPINPQVQTEVNRFAIESTLKAIPAIYRRCPNTSEKGMRLNLAIYQEASEMIRYARRYEQVMFCFELADRGQFDVRFDPISQAIAFSYSNPQEDNADTLLRSREISSRWERQFTEPEKAELREVVEVARVEITGSIIFDNVDQISYKFSPSLLSVGKRWAIALKNLVNWEFPENLALGGVTFGDFRRFWAALICLLNIHDLAHEMASSYGSGGLPHKSIANLRSRQEWAELIAQIGGLSVTACSELMSWYTFDRSIGDAAAASQLFHDVGGEHLCVSYRLALAIDAERNLQKILTRHPRLKQIAVALANVKEKIALDYLSNLFTPSKFTVGRTLVIEGVTDADLVIYEKLSGFVLIIQHKWLISPDTATESGSNDEQLKAGASQAVKARDALRLDQDHVRHALRLASSDPIETIEATVICRGLENSGFLEAQEVPIVMERAFEQLWNESDSLEHLWEHLNVRPDREKAADQFQEASMSIKLAGYEFHAPALQIRVKI